MAAMPKIRADVGGYHLPSSRGFLLGKIVTVPKVIPISATRTHLSQTCVVTILFKTCVPYALGLSTDS